MSEIDLSKVVICTPVGGGWGVAAQVTEWLCNQRAKGVHWVGQIANSVAYARNFLVDRVLKEHPHATHIFFTDGDVAPYDPNTPVIERLLVTNKDIICPIVPQFSIPDGVPAITSVVAPLGQKSTHGLAVFSELPRELFECQVIGGGAILVKTDVFRRLPWPWFRWLFTREKILCSEDFYFSQIARNAGFSLWCDPTVVCEHFRAVPIGQAYDGALNAASVPSPPPKEQSEIFIDGDAPESEYAAEFDALEENGFAE